ncbi:hypothetical protein AB1E18_013986 [Capra hircus]
MRLGFREVIQRRKITQRGGKNALKNDELPSLRFQSFPWADKRTANISATVTFKFLAKNEDQHPTNDSSGGFVSGLCLLSPLAVSPTWLEETLEVGRERSAPREKVGPPRGGCQKVNTRTKRERGGKSGERAKDRPSRGGRSGTRGPPHPTAWAPARRAAAKRTALSSGPAPSFLRAAGGDSGRPPPFPSGAGAKGVCVCVCALGGPGGHPEACFLPRAPRGCLLSPQQPRSAGAGGRKNKGGLRPGRRAGPGGREEERPPARPPAPGPAPLSPPCPPGGGPSTWNRNAVQLASMAAAADPPPPHSPRSGRLLSRRRRQQSGGGGGGGSGSGGSSTWQRRARPLPVTSGTHHRRGERGRGGSPEPAAAAPSGPDPSRAAPRPALGLGAQPVPAGGGVRAPAAGPGWGRGRGWGAASPPAGVCGAAVRGPGSRSRGSPGENMEDARVWRGLAGHGRAGGGDDVGPAPGSIASPAGPRRKARAAAVPRLSGPFCAARPLPPSWRKPLRLGVSLPAGISSQRNLRTLGATRI